VKSWKYGPLALRDDPWGFGNSLEWATSCPPPRHNFLEIPRIRSERPAFEAHYPELVPRLHAEAYAGWHPGGAPVRTPGGLVAGTGPRQGPNDPDVT
jgi:cytochrome c oxidase subunit I